MAWRHESIWVLGVFVLSTVSTAFPSIAKTYRLGPKDLENALQNRVALAESGDVLVIPQGSYSFSRNLTVGVPKVSIVGAGRSKTKLNFASQTTGGESILVAANDVRIEGISVVDPPADGVVARGTTGLRIRDVSVEWGADGSAKNGAYGIYPVSSTGLLIEKCYARGASEAGIYVGQSSDGIVRNNHVEGNVVGIDIENSVRIRVEGNLVERNSLGILVAARPRLFQPTSVDNEVVGNRVRDNNLPTFAPPESFLRRLGDSRGAVVVASSGTEFEKNEFSMHQGSDLLLLNFQSLGMDDLEDVLFSFDLNGTKVGKNKFTGSSDKATPKAAKRQDSTGANVVWDGVISAKPFRPELRPIPVCRTRGVRMTVVNLSIGDSGENALETIPICQGPG